VTKIGELGTTQAATSNRRTLRKDTILHSHRRENLKFYNVVHSSPILVTLMMKAIRSSETSVLAIAALRNIPEDGILFCKVLACGPLRSAGC
jgi:hypothetical protein